MSRKDAWIRKSKRLQMTKKTKEDRKWLQKAAKDHILKEWPLKTWQIPMNANIYNVLVIENSE